MVLASGAPVNIWYADTKDIDGKAHGQMLLELSADPALTQKMLAFLDSQHVAYEKEEAEYYG